MTSAKTCSAPTSSAASAVAAPAFQVDVLHDWEAFDALGDEWLDLHDRAHAGLFSARGWLRAIRAAWADEFDPFFVIVRRDGRVAAAAPLALARMPVSKRLPSLTVPTLQLLSCRYSGFVDFPHEDAEALAALVDAIVSMSDRLVIRFEVLREGPTFEMLRERLAAADRRVLTAIAFESVTIDATLGWERWLSSRPRSFRKSLRVAEKRQKAAGLISEAHDYKDDKQLERALAVSARSWKGSAGTALGATADGACFARALWREFAPYKDFLLNVIRDEREDVAFILSFKRSGTAYGLWIEFDERFAALSPGKLAIADQVRELMGRRSRVYDLVRKTHFTEGFGDGSYRIYRLVATPVFSLARLGIEADALVAATGAWLRSRLSLGGRRRRTRRADIVRGGRS